VPDVNRVAGRFYRCSGGNDILSDLNHSQPDSDDLGGNSRNSHRSWPGGEGFDPRRLELCFRGLQCEGDCVGSPIYRCGSGSFGTESKSMSGRTPGLD
jgi:hypothetical protein